ncbi:MAG: hypothetical protein UR26_C0003G0124 [candidate division TM6 bacterium GW2011_GWF2_32_72]|nr:MAG: hypothetical protein UR26_C0003G0124 [candidate division TM6 bacterium GW2011_GWF2_32_72]
MKVILLLIGILSSSLIYSSEWHTTKEKLNNDQFVFSFSKKDKFKNISLENNMISTTWGLPALVEYNQFPGYNVKIIIEISPEIAKLISPSSLTNSITEKTKCFFLIYTPLMPYTNHLNIRFHPWVAKYILNKQENFGNWSQNVNMGIFEIKNIKPLDIASDTLKGTNVFIHGQPDGLMSPDNAQFILKNKETDASFWLFGSYKDESIVTYNLLLNQNNETIKIDNLTTPNSEHSLIEILNKLKKDSDETTKEWINKVENAIGIQTVDIKSNELNVLQEKLKQLKETLNKLTTKLKTLIF